MVNDPCDTKTVPGTLDVYVTIWDYLRLYMAKLYTVRQAARKLCVAEITLRQWIGKGKIGSVKAGGKRLISQDHIEAFLQPAEVNGILQ